MDRHTRVLRQLYQAALGDRPRIEAAWVRDVMLPNNWLDIAISQDVATIIAYPATDNAFRREVDLAGWAEAFGLEELLLAQVAPNTSDIIMYGDEGRRATVPIWSVIWIDDTDPSLVSYAFDEHPHELVVPF